MGWHEDIGVAWYVFELCDAFYLEKVNIFTHTVGAYQVLIHL